LSSNIMLLQALVYALFEQSPDRAAVIARFRGVVEEMTTDFPPETTSEKIVELRARADLLLRQLLQLQASKQ
jgi:hypothetical protein